jgi:hypothetical protein
VALRKMVFYLRGERYTGASKRLRSNILPVIRTCDIILKTAG